jgi:hypothetical protein
MRRRHAGWRPLLGQHAAAQGHLRNLGVGAGDLFLFWGLFRYVDDHLKWVGPPVHVIWGWFQVGAVAPVDATARGGLDGAWRWAADHPHLAFPPDPANTLYLAADTLSVAGAPSASPGGGVFETYFSARQK